MKPTAERLSPVRLAAARAAAAAARVAAARTAASSPAPQLVVASMETGVGSREAILEMIDAANSNSGLDKYPEQQDEPAAETVRGSTPPTPATSSSSGPRQDTTNYNARKTSYGKREVLRRWPQGKRKGGGQWGVTLYRRPSEHLRSAPKEHCETVSKAHCELPFREQQWKPAPKQQQQQQQQPHQGVKNNCPTKADPPRQSSIEFSRHVNGMSQVIADIGESLKRSAGLLQSEKKHKRQRDNNSPAKGKTSRNSVKSSPTAESESKTFLSEKCIEPQSRAGSKTKLVENGHKNPSRSRRGEASNVDAGAKSSKRKPCTSYKLYSSSKPSSRKKTGLAKGKTSQHLKLKNRDGETLLKEQPIPWTGLTYCDGRPFIPGEIDPHAVCNADVFSKIESERKNPKTKTKSDTVIAGHRKSPKLALTDAHQYVPEVCSPSAGRILKSKTDLEKKSKRAKSDIVSEERDQPSVPTPTTYCDGRPTVSGKFDSAPCTPTAKKEPQKETAETRRKSFPVTRGQKQQPLEQKPLTYCDGKPFLSERFNPDAVCATTSADEPKEKQNKEFKRSKEKPGNYGRPVESKEKRNQEPKMSKQQCEEQQPDDPKMLVDCDGKRFDPSSVCKEEKKTETPQKRFGVVLHKDAARPTAHGKVLTSPQTYCDGRPFEGGKFDPSYVCTSEPERKRLSEQQAPDVTRDKKLISGTKCDGKPLVPGEFDPSSVCNATVTDEKNKGKMQSLGPKPQTYCDGKLFVPGQFDPSAVCTSAVPDEHDGQRKTNQCEEQLLDHKTHEAVPAVRTRERGTNTTTKRTPQQSKKTTKVRNPANKNTATSSKSKRSLRNRTDAAKSKETVTTVGGSRLKSKKKKITTRKNGAKKSTIEFHRLVGSPMYLYQRRNHPSPTVNTDREKLPHRRRDNSSLKSKENCRPREPMPKSLNQTARVQKEKQAAEAAKERCESLKQKMLQTVLGGNRDTGAGPSETDAANKASNKSKTSLKNNPKTTSQIRCRQNSAEYRTKPRTATSARHRCSDKRIATKTSIQHKRRCAKTTRTKFCKT